MKANPDVLIIVLDGLPGHGNLRLQNRGRLGQDSQNAVRVRQCSGVS